MTATIQHTTVTLSRANLVCSMLVDGLAARLPDCCTTLLGFDGSQTHKVQATRMSAHLVCAWLTEDAEAAEKGRHVHPLHDTTKSVQIEVMLDAAGNPTFRLKSDERAPERLVSEVKFALELLAG